MNVFKKSYIAITILLLAIPMQATAGFATGLAVGAGLAGDFGEREKLARRLEKENKELKEKVNELQEKLEKCLKDKECNFCSKGK